MGDKRYNEESLDDLLLDNPVYGKHIIKKQAVLNSIFLIFIGGIFYIPFIGIFLGFPAWVYLIINCRMLLGAWCTYKKIPRYKKIFLLLAWQAACLGIGLLAGYAVRILLLGSFR